LGGKHIREFNGAGMMDAKIADALNAEGLRNSLGGMFDHNTVHLLRRRWNIPTVKINGVEHNPLRWSDGSYSIQCAALALRVTEQTVFKWLKRGKLHGRQLTKGQPWQVDLTDRQIKALIAPKQCMRRSRKTAS
jgi:hypothetical protein